jgi:Rrf2 family iron-sulfur cluster assembly transcriptional regulator
LARGTEDIAIADIILAVDEQVDTTNCSGSEDCQDQQRCLTHDLWQALSDQIREFLSEISLAETMKRSSVLEVATRQDKVLRNYLKARTSCTRHA